MLRPQLPSPYILPYASNPEVHGSDCFLSSSVNHPRMADSFILTQIEFVTSLKTTCLARDLVFGRESLLRCVPGLYSVARSAFCEDE
jgi:hypothetical protein